MKLIVTAVQVNLLIFCLLDTSINEKGVLKSPTILVDLWILNSLKFYQFWAPYFDTLLLSVYTQRIVMFSWKINPFTVMPIFIPHDFPYSEVCFLWN